MRTGKEYVLAGFSYLENVVNISEFELVELCETIGMYFAYCIMDINLSGVGWGLNIFGELGQNSHGINYGGLKGATYVSIFLKNNYRTIGLTRSYMTL